MKTRALLLILTISSMIFYSCEGDLPPEKSVGNITFVITEENTPQTLSGVSIQLFSDDDPSVTPTDRTDVSGRCTFSNIPKGLYHLNLSKPGYESKEDLPLRINGGDNPYQEISLKRATTTLTVAPDVLDFGDNESVVQKAFSLVNPNYEDLTWAVLDTDVPWIVSVCDKDGKKSGTIEYNQEVAMSVTIDRDALTSGNNESTIVILSNYGRAELHVTAIGVRENIVLNTLDVSEITETSVIFNGEVVNPGIPQYTARGFVYSTISMPTLENTIAKVTYKVSEDKKYACNVTNLIKDKVYYVRAFAQNSKGVVYSTNEVEFRTSSTLSEVKTLDVETIYIQNGRAVLKGEIVAKGVPVYSEKGFCVNTSGEPTISDNKYPVSGYTEGIFSYNLSPIQDNTTYYIRAYVIQNGRIEYGNVVLLSTLKRTTRVTTMTASNYTDMGLVSLNGAIIDEGNPCFYEKGFCYATHSNPQISDNKHTVLGTEKGNFSAQVWLKETNQNYYYRAYAIQNDETVYGDVMPITRDNRLAQVETVNKKSVTSNYVILYGNVKDTGHPYITERGIEYGTTNSYSSTWKRKSDMYRQKGEYAIQLYELSGGTTYYYRAYVMQDGVPIYGQIYNFKTYQMPLIYTEYTSIPEKYTINSFQTYYRVELSGIEMRSAYPASSEYGFVYGTSSDIEVGDIGAVSVTTNNINLEGNYKVFSHNVEKLYPNTTYYYRAYCVFNGEYYYGDIESFTTDGY